MASINQFVPFLAIFVTIFATPETVVKILTPDYEDKIVENQKLTSEIDDKDKLIVEKELETKKLNKKIKDLNEKNYADIQKVGLVYDGAEKDTPSSIALINDSVYLNDKMVEGILEEKISYDDIEQKIYIGGKGDRVTKETLTGNYAMLYDGKEYVSLGNKESNVDYTVGGVALKDGFVINSRKYIDYSYVLIRLDGKYSSIEFDVGKVDETNGSIEDAKMKVYVDGEEKYSDVLNSQVTSQHFQYDVTDAKSLKISLYDSYSKFGFSNVIFNKK